MVSDASGNDVCVVTAWQYSQIVGELHAEFDGQGNITSCMGTPHMMLADSFKRKNADGERVEIEDGSALVECEFAVTKFVSGFEAAGIQEIQINRLFNFVRKLTGEKDPGEIGFNHFDRCHCMRIA